MHKIWLPGKNNKVIPTIDGAEEKKPQNLPRPPSSPGKVKFNDKVHEIKVKLAEVELEISLIVADYNKFIIDVNNSTGGKKLDIDEITIQDIINHSPALTTEEYMSLDEDKKKIYNDIQQDIRNAKNKWDSLQTQLYAAKANISSPPGDNQFLLPPPPPPPSSASGIRTKKRKRKQKSKKGKTKKKRKY